MIDKAQQRACNALFASAAAAHSRACTRAARVGKPAPKWRPPDGKVIKSKFDAEEFRTRRDERRAADPEKFERERAAERMRRNQFWSNYTEKRDFDRGDEAMAEALAESIHFNPPGWSRLHDIWSAVRSFEMGLEYWHSLPQAKRIAATKKHRVRGCGRAAKLAGF